MSFANTDGWSETLQYMAYTKGLKKVNLFKLIEESKITDNVKRENVHCVLHIYRLGDQTSVRFPSGQYSDIN